MAKYRDLDIFFRKGDDGDIRFISDSSSIVQSIKNIVMTRYGERPFNSFFGTNVLNLFFESPNLVDIAFLQSDIKKMLELMEPRIRVNNVTIDYPLISDSTSDVKINISYYLNTKQKTNIQNVSLTVN